MLVRSYSGSDMRDGGAVDAMLRDAGGEGTRRREELDETKGYIVDAQ